MRYNTIPVLVFCVVVIASLPCMVRADAFCRRVSDSVSYGACTLSSCGDWSTYGKSANGADAYQSRECVGSYAVTNNYSDYYAYACSGSEGSPSCDWYNTSCLPNDSGNMYHMNGNGGRYTFILGGDTPVADTYGEKIDDDGHVVAMREDEGGLVLKWVGGYTHEYAQCFSRSNMFAPYCASTGASLLYYTTGQSSQTQPCHQIQYQTIHSCNPVATCVGGSVVNSCDHSQVWQTCSSSCSSGACVGGNSGSSSGFSASASGSSANGSACTVGQPYTITMQATDPAGDQIKYEVSWGDGSAHTITPVSGYVLSGTTQTASHTYHAYGAPTLTYRSIDQGGNMSAWKFLSVTCSCVPSYSCFNASTIVRTDAQCNTSIHDTCSPPYFCSDGSPVCLSSLSSSATPNINKNPVVAKHLKVLPSILRKGNSARVSWNVSNVQSCTVSGNGDVWNTTSSGSDGNTTSPINQQVVYTLSCQALPGGSPSSIVETKTVNIAPIWSER